MKHFNERKKQDSNFHENGEEKGEEKEISKGGPNALELRMKLLLELLGMLLECDGLSQPSDVSISAHMNGLKVRQHAVLEAGGASALVAVLSLGERASDELYALAAHAVSRICRATDSRHSPGKISISEHLNDTNDATSSAEVYLPGQ